MKLKYLLLFAITAFNTLSYGQTKPNIVLFFVDDFGQRDLSCYGSTFYETPNMDRLANDGVRFTDAYVSFPRCVPSRKALLSGKYHFRTPEKTNGHYMPLEEETFGEALKEGGYNTCYIGKWHLGSTGGEPNAQGFDTAIHTGKAGGPGQKGWYFPGSSTMKVINPVQGKEGDYLTDMLTKEAVNYIDQKAKESKPFLMVMAHYAVHDPIRAPKETSDKYKEKLKKLGIKPGGAGKEHDQKLDHKGMFKTEQNNPTYAAMIEKADNSLGRILDKINEEQIENETVVILISDHGGLSSRGITSHREMATSNLPLRHGKGHVYEGGLRIPMIVKYPGVTKKGTISEVQVTSTDHYPTLLEIAGLPLKPEQHSDGVSYLKALKGKKYQRDGMLFFKDDSRTQSTGDTGGIAYTEGDYKVIDWIEEGHVSLYNIKEDIGEQNDLAAKMPRKVKKLLCKMKAVEGERGVIRRKQMVDYFAKGGFAGAKKRDPSH
ncbi:sulfatase [Flavobacteriaceae bacterium]|nr:sulfatase [Flavobacteriaceae bacterium]